MNASKDWQLLIAGLVGAVLGATLLAAGMFLGQPTASAPDHAGHSPKTTKLVETNRKSIVNDEPATELSVRNALLAEKKPQSQAALPVPRRSIVLQNQQQKPRELPTEEPTEPKERKVLVDKEPLAAKTESVHKKEEVDVAQTPILSPSVDKTAFLTQPKSAPIDDKRTPVSSSIAPESEVSTSTLATPVRVVPPAPGTGRKLIVVTTTTNLKSIVESIGGARVEVTCLATGYEDPHFIEPKPSYMMQAKRADLWIRSGLELEIGYEQPILDGSRNSKIRPGTPGHLDAATGVLRLEVPTTKVDRSMGDVHPSGNPHYWLDPLNARIVAGTIARRMSTLSPADAAYFEYNHERFRRSLDIAMFGEVLVERVGGGQLWAFLLQDRLDSVLKNPSGVSELGGWLAKVKPYAESPIVTYHRSWSYFAHRFRFVVIDELEPKPGISPSPRHLAKVIDQVRSRGAKALLAEPYFNRRVPDYVAQRTEIRVLVVANSVGGQAQATDYIAMIDTVVTRLVATLAETNP